MPELDRFDARMQAEVHAFADGAVTDVDAMAVAERAIPARRGGALAWLSHPLPVPVSTLIVLGLLLATLAWVAFAGSQRPDRASVVPTPLPSAPALLAPTPLPTTDGEGAETVSRLDSTPPTSVAPPSYSVVDGVTEVRGGTYSMSFTANDRRASGTGELAFSADLYPSGDSVAGPAWGTLTLSEAWGLTWSGPCTGGTWGERPMASRASDSVGASYAWSCWLAGSGPHAESTYVLRMRWDAVGGPVDFVGVIYPAAPPTSSPAP
jgi:hypothetical protein